MRSTSGIPERRTNPRFSGEDMQVLVRQRGRMARAQSRVVDFNRFGIALITSERLEKNKPLFLTLTCHGVHLENVVGVLHNCIAHADGYRCGIQFRTQSTLQFDRNFVERTLSRLEQELITAPGDDPEQVSAAQ